MTTALGKNSALMLSKAAIAVTDGVDLISESLTNEMRPYEGDAEALWGDRELDVADQVIVAEAPAGSFTYRPRYTDLSLLFELALGAGDDDAWTPLTTGAIAAFYIEVQKAGVHSETYTGAKINELTLRSEQNNALTAEANIIAASAAEAGTPTVPTYEGIGGVAPIMHNDLVITGDAGLTGLKPFSVQWHFMNNLNDDGFANTKNRQFIEAEGFDADMEVELNLDSALAGYINTWYTTNPKTPLEIIATYTSGDYSLTITFRGVITTPPPTISAPGKQRYTLGLSGRATKTGTPYAITENMVSVVVDDTGE